MKILLLIFCINIFCLANAMAQAIDTDSKCSSFLDSLQNRNIYTQTEQMPEYPGGKDSLNAYITSNLKETLDKISYSETIVISFIIEADGSLTNNKIEKLGDPILSWELKDLLAKSKKWNAGKCNGKAVPVKCSFPFYVKRK